MCCGGVQVLAERPTTDGRREFLVQCLDDHDDAWVHERDMAADVIEDWELGLEVAQAEALEDMVEDKLARKFRVCLCSPHATWGHSDQAI